MKNKEIGIYVLDPLLIVFALVILRKRILGQHQSCRHFLFPPCSPIICVGRFTLSCVTFFARSIPPRPFWLRGGGLAS